MENFYCLIFTRLPVFEKDETVENYSNFHINEYNGSYFSQCFYETKIRR